MPAVPNYALDQAFSFCLHEIYQNQKHDTGSPPVFPLKSCRPEIKSVLEQNIQH